MARISRRELCRRIVEYLRWAAEQEENKIYWDEYCIAWMTVAGAAKGNSIPFIAATQKHLGIHPDRVWSSVLKRRRSKLGTLYGLWYDVAGNLKPDVPKKSAHSEKFAAVVSARKVAGAEEVSRNQKPRELLNSRGPEAVIGTPAMATLTATTYPNSGQSASANIAASICLSCHCPVSASRRLCQKCLTRGHSSECPSPNSQCLCGFSEMFWRDVCAGVAFDVGARAPREIRRNEPQGARRRATDV